MIDSYINLITKYKDLDIESKKEKLVEQLKELLEVLYNTNNYYGDNSLLPFLNNYENDDEYFVMLFTYIISLKEEYAKLIEKVEN